MFALAIVITGCASHDSYSKCLQYVYDEETATAMVSGIIPCLDEDSTNIIIPPTVIYNERKYRVNHIGDRAFEHCDYIVSVSIPKSVICIGAEAFRGCDSLTSIIVQGGNAIYDSRNNCNAIIETATNTLVVGCKNTTIPNSVTSIGERAFCDCSNLTSVTIGNSVTSIGNYAFDNCSNLSSVNIGNNVKNIGMGAFSGCNSLTSIEIPNGVTSIGNHAFSSCNSLISVTIPSSVTSIGEKAFNGRSLISIIASANHPIFSSSDGVLFNKDMTTLILCPGGKKGKYIIPNSVTSIGDYAFYECDSLTIVTIPSSVTRIGERAFSYCDNLAYATIPNSVSKIGLFAFDGCSSLIIQIPERFREEVEWFGGKTCKEVRYNDSNSWIYGTWKCRTPYGTIKVILQEDGRMYDSTNEGWFSYTIEGNRIIEKCKGYISTYNIDRANERFDCGEPGVWFYKE